VCRWLDGTVATVEEFADSEDAARDLAGFLVALHGFDPGEIPPERRAELRQDSLADRDARTRTAIEEVADTFDTAAMIMVWQAALDAPENGSPRWVHGDFHTGNLLTQGGRVTTVIDFGGFTHGDPAFDLMMAYTLLSPRCRATFRDAVGLDDATWARGRGWALCTGLNAYTAYAATHPRVAAQTSRQITQALIG
jgi:aminoglycoside phosphotransferase (APT) family kinase protein